MKNVIIYHKDCMDGLSSAFIAYSSLLENDEIAEFFPMQYNDIDLISNMLIDEETHVFILDFSVPVDVLRDISYKANHVTILDHHKTAEHLREEKLDNFTFVFDNSKSGAILTFEYFKDLAINPLEELFFRYIQDRDLWQWKLQDSEEFSMALKILVKPNDINSLRDAYFVFDKDIKSFLDIGRSALKYQKAQIDSKVNKCYDTKFLGQQFKIINATENISELGDAIVKKFDLPVILFFYVEPEKVVLSFRSAPHLTDVSVVAKELGGGGHREAAGCSVSPELLIKILNGVSHN